MRRVRWFLLPVLAVILVGPADASAQPEPPDLPPTPESAAPEGPVPNVPLTNVRQVTAGYYHSCALLTNRQVRCWGYNGYGGLGNGTDDGTNRAVVTRNASGTGPLVNVTQVSAGIYHTCAVLTNRQVRCWGYNGYGALGDGTDDNRFRPVTVRNPAGTGPLQNVVRIDANAYHTCALLTNRQVRCWGYNQYGQVGDGTTDHRARPRVVRNPAGTGPLVNVTDVAVGYDSTCVTLANRQARCWGRNAYGNLGDGTDDNRLRPTLVKNAAGTGPLRNVAQVNPGEEFSCALLTNRQVRCWGDNGYGELGDGNHPNDSFLPRVVRNSADTGPLGGVTHIEVGDYLACARLANGQARCWGDGEYGGMGNGGGFAVNDLPRTVQNPTLTGSLTGVSQLDAGDYTACARLTSGQVRCWGYGQHGNIGNGQNNVVQLRTARVLVA